MLASVLAYLQQGVRVGITRSSGVAHAACREVGARSIQSRPKRRGKRNGHRRCKRARTNRVAHTARIIGGRRYSFGRWMRRWRTDGIRATHHSNSELRSTVCANLGYLTTGIVSDCSGPRAKFWGAQFGGGDCGGRHMACSTTGKADNVKPGTRAYNGVRVGEASHPGPITYGGASSSGENSRSMTKWTMVGHQKWMKAVAEDSDEGLLLGNKERNSEIGQRDPGCENDRVERQHPYRASVNCCQECSVQGIAVEWAELNCGCIGVYCPNCCRGTRRCRRCLARARFQLLDGWRDGGMLDGVAAHASIKHEWPTLQEVAHQATFAPSRATDVLEAGNASGCSMSSLYGSKGLDDTVCFSCEILLVQPGVCWRLCVCGRGYCTDCVTAYCRVCGHAIGGERGYDNGYDCDSITCDGYGSLDGHRHHEAAETGRNETSCSYISPYWYDSRAILTCLRPDEALSRRDAKTAQHTQLLNDMRRDGRVRIKQQRCGHLRPARRRKRKEGMSLVTANISAEGTLRAKADKIIQWGRSIFMVQEHRARNDKKMAFEDWLEQQGLRCVVDDAYIKHVEEGGGTAIVGPPNIGLRPAPGSPSIAEGRVSVAVLDVGVDVAVGTVYGISSAPVSRQLSLWKAVAHYLRTLGLPFAIGGDWQVQPDEMKATGILDVLDASVVAPEEPTCTLTGNTLDYFMISKSLLQGDERPRVLHGLGFQPHFPVEVTLNLGKKVTMVNVLPRPRPLPIDPPIGPQFPGAKVQWDDWYNRIAVETGQELFEDVQDTVVLEWYAAAELETISRSGLFDDEQEPYHMGLGTVKQPVSRPARGRFSRVPDEAGLIGARLSWITCNLRVCARYAKMMADAWRDPEAWAGSEKLRNRFSRMAVQLWRIGRHAQSLLYSKRGKCRGSDAEMKAVHAGLKTLAEVARPRHRQPPLHHMWQNAKGTWHIWRFERLANDIDVILAALLRRQRKQDAKAVRAWAATAPASAAHKATKLPKGSRPITASARKHVNEPNPQLAADRGIEEWGDAWMAGDSDAADDILRNIEELQVVSDFEGVELAPIDGGRIKEAARKFRGNTGVGIDWLRPRHVATMSCGARAALAWILNQIEYRRRWPAMIREVVAVALPKKTGGCRLIGLATALYRIWAKVRYNDCRKIIEERISRPFLASAPRRGAIDAAFEIAWNTEHAAARGYQAAGVLVDFKSYFDHLGHDEYAKGALVHGLPKTIIALCAHLYMGPRRIRVGEAVSTKKWPRRSVLPGCTWAMLYVRFHVVGPAESLISECRLRFRGLNLSMLLNIYVDDAALVLWGEVDALTLMLRWTCLRLMRWVKEQLQKEIADGKLKCIVSSTALKNLVGKALGHIKVPVDTHGDLLGVDCSMGGQIRKRVIQRKRIAGATARTGRIRWWRGIAGKAMHVVRVGVRPQGTYGVEVVGINSTALRGLRKVHAAAARISCAASSTTAKLAIGGEGFSDADPAVLDVGAPFFRVIAKLWDSPADRASFVAMWHRAVQDINEHGVDWKRVRGPVWAAILTIIRADAAWMTPFVIDFMDHEVDLLTVPPMQVQIIFKAQARMTLDKALVRSATKQWLEFDRTSALKAYRYGINWDVIRDALREKQGGETGALKRNALEAVVCRGFWHEERKWTAGSIGTATCGACMSSIGDDEHKLHGCDALAYHLFWEKAKGEYNAPRSFSNGSAPLLLRWNAWPPITSPWAPIDDGGVEGLTGDRLTGEVFGDGSGYGQQSKYTRCASWAVVAHDQNGCARKVRGHIAGWFPTVPRAELAACLHFLRVASPPACYIGDCKMVIDGVKDGVDEEKCTSQNFNADLWRQIRDLSARQRHSITFAKTKAHRSRQIAEQDGNDPLEWWIGNRVADAYAKQLCGWRYEQQQFLRNWEQHTREHRTCLEHIATAAAWCFRHWPSVRKGRKSKRRTAVTQSGSLDGSGHWLVPRAKGGWRCKHCLREVWTKQGIARMRARQCSGDVTAKTHPTHSLKETRGVLWCIRCGAHTTRMPRTLIEVCSEQPRSAAYKNIIRRLGQGLLPTEGHERTAEIRGEIGHRPWEGVGPDGVVRGSAPAPADAGATRKKHQNSAAKPRAKRLREEAIAVLSAKRRRLTSKGPEPACDEKAILDASCGLLVGKAWTERIRAIRCAVESGCILCAKSTRCVCRGCERRVCIACARSKIPCPTIGLDVRR